MQKSDKSNTLLFRTEHLVKRYGKKTILRDVSLYAKKGECVGVLGMNGCGKSTLLAILAGTIKKNSGTVHFEEPGLKIGYVPQENPLMEQLSVMDNLRFWYAGSHKKLLKDLQEGPPAMLGLNSCLRQKASKLSGGLKKRLSIACALAEDPALLILDEPGASLDFVCKEDIKAYLAYYMSQGGCVVLTSHEEAEISICTRSYYLSDGILTDLFPGSEISFLKQQAQSFPL